MTGPFIRQWLRGSRGVGGLVVLALFVALAFSSAGAVHAAAVSVANCNDNGSGSLRNAISSAATGDTITFATDCPTSGPIRLTGGSLTLSQSVTIDGTGRHIVIDGNCTTDANSDCTGGGNTVFHVTGGTVTFNALTIQHGNTPTSFGGGPPGGGILNDFGRVTVANSTITRNHAAGGGGGIANNDDHNLTVTNSTIANNSALQGGGIDTGYNETVTITNSTISNNSSGGGGGIYGGGGTLNVSNSLIVNNTGYQNMSDDVGGFGITTDTANLTGSFTFANSETAPQDHGGPTRTLAIPTPANPTSTDAYQGGNLAACQRISPAYDQRGAARVVAGKCSIGAFEPGLVNTATALTANPTSAAFGSSVTFTASVSGVRGGTPPDSAGSVTFASNGATLGTANLAGGSATFTTSSLSPGNSVTATYAAGGAGNLYGASPASNAVSVTIDASPPATTATLAGTAGSNGWYTSTVTVTLAATDPDGAADVASTTYMVDGGAAQSYAAPFIVSGDGTHTVTFSSTDKAGNVETTKTQTIKIDATLPTAIVGTPDRAPDAGGYYNHSVTVTFAGQDATSGIASCTSPRYSGPDGRTVAVGGSCTDDAGNVGAGSVALKYDATPPTAIVGTPDRAPDSNGWYDKPVAVTFAGTDATSGIVSCTTGATYGGPDSAAARVPGTCTDTAGNVGTGSFALAYDATAPVTTATPDRPANASGWYSAAVAVALAATDGVSRVAASEYNLDGAGWTVYTGAIAVAGDGVHTLLYRSTDTAGNREADRSLTVRIDTHARPVSIAVAPGAATIKVGQVQQLAATGTYADGSTADLTSRVAWSSDVPDAAVDAAGQVTGKAAGTAHVTATQGAVSGQVTVTVTPPVLTGVQPAPAPASRPSGASVPGTPAPAPIPSGSPTSGGSAPAAAPTGR